MSRSLTRVIRSLKRTKTPDQGSHDFTDAPASRADHQHSRLLGLPVELLSDILEHVTQCELYALRSTCRSACQLLSAGDVVLPWARAQITDLDHYNIFRPHTDLFGPQSTASSTLAEMLGDVYRIELSARASDWLLRTVLRYHHDNLDLDITRDAQLECQPGIVIGGPGLLVLDRYLTYYRDLILNPSQDRDQRSISQSFMIRYSPQTLYDAHKTFLLLCWLMRKLFDHDSGKGIRLFNQKPRTNDEQIRQFVVIYGIRGIHSLTRLTSPSKRESYVLRMLNDLDPIRNPEGWKQAWYLSEAMPFQRYRELDEVQHALKVNFGWQDIWIDAAKERLSSTDFVYPRLIEDGRQKNFIKESDSDIAGYYAISQNSSGHLFRDRLLNHLGTARMDA